MKLYASVTQPLPPPSDETAPKDDSPDPGMENIFELPPDTGEQPGDAMAPDATPAAPLDNVSRYLKRMMAVDRVNGLLREAATAPRGRRQSTYFWCANRFREIVDEGVLDLAEAHDLLFNAAMESADPGKEGVVLQAIRVLR